MSALTDESTETIGDNEVDTEEGNGTIIKSSEVEMGIVIGKTKSAKIKKAVIHESDDYNIVLKGVEKMKAMNLPLLRHMKNKRMARE